MSGSRCHQPQIAFVFTNFSEEVDESGGHVVPVISQFRGFVVPWEDVMVVVPTFAQSQDRTQWMIGRFDGSVDRRLKYS